ncbi:hypothetical protein [Lonepinella sp. BR2919]|uniref:hypothetical protein n=1 Tax=unclassified Lonepinella TaxID=2642006 RepID=UPI003F6DAE48
MGDKQPSFGNNLVTYTGAFSVVSAGLIRMYCSQEHLETLLTISGAVSPMFGMWAFRLISSKMKSDADLAFEKTIQKRIDFLNTQIEDMSYSQQQKQELTEEKLKLVKELISRK